MPLLLRLPRVLRSLFSAPLSAAAADALPSAPHDHLAGPNQKTCKVYVCFTNDRVFVVASSCGSRVV